jgi:hypothetical protein
MLYRIREINDIGINDECKRTVGFAKPRAGEDVDILSEARAVEQRGD